MPTVFRRIISYINRMFTSPLSRYGALILLVALIFALYFTINHQVTKPYGTGPSIISEHVIIQSEKHPFNSTTYSPDASGDGPLWDNNNDLTNQTTYDSSLGNVKQMGSFVNKIQGLLYDRGDGCSSIKSNYTDYAIGNTSNTNGLIPQIPLPAYYRRYKIGLISADNTKCGIPEKITNSISDNDIGIIFWTQSDQDLPDSNQTTVPVFSINLNSSNQLKSELQDIYDGFIKNSSTYRALRITMVPFQPLSPNFWFVSMISVAGVLILSFFVSIILHVRIHRGRRRQIEQIRFQRDNEEALGMKKWTLDKEVIGTFPVIIYSRKIAPTETGEEKTFPEEVVESKSSSDGGERKEETDDVNNIGDDGVDEQSRQHKLCRKSSTRSTKSQRSEKAVGNASVLYSSPDTDATNSDHISSSETRETCAICLEDFDNGDEVRELPCRHWYHVECIDPWLTTKSSSCPLCKKDCKPENVEGNDERSTVVDIREVHDRESQSSQVVDGSQNHTPGSSPSRVRRGVIWFMNKMFRPRQRQREIANESEGEVHLEMDNIHTSGNV